MKVDTLKNHPSTKLAKKLKSKHPKAMRSVIRQSLAPLVLAGPGTVASIIKKEQLDFGSTLKILIYGAKQIEILDNCSWYQLIPDCLKENFSVEVVAYGRDISPHTTSQVKTQLEPIKHSRYTVVDDLFDGHDISEFDLAITFAHDPKSVEHEEEKALLNELVRNNVPTFISHYTVFTGALSAYAHSESGYYSHNKSFINHYALPSDPKTGLTWGNVVYSLQPSQKRINPLALNERSPEKVLQELAGVAMHLSREPGLSKAAIISQCGKKEFHLVEGVYLNLEKDVLHTINDDLSLQEVPREQITQYVPTEESNYLEKLIWSMLTVLEFSKSQYANDKEVVNA